MQVGIATRASLNDPHCGDQCGHWQVDGKTTLCVADGLGHGPDAEAAARAAIDYVGRHLSRPLPDIFAGCDLALRGTRGAVMGIALIDAQQGTLTYGGVGDTRALIVRRPALEPAQRKTFHLRGNWGIVGAGYKTLSPECVPLNPGDLVMLCTDGLPETIDMSPYDDRLVDDLPRLAGSILRDWGRETDDAAVLVCRAELT